MSVALTLGACSEAQPATLQSIEPDPVASRAAASALARRVAFRRHELHSRWSRTFPVAQGSTRRACPAGSASELLIMARDARTDARHLLPLLFTERLASAELASLTADAPASDKPEDELARIDEFATRRFAGVFHLLDYGAPRRIRRVDRDKPEWIAGIVVAQFAVYDLDRHEPLCYAQLVVRNDVTDVPLSRRLEAQVRERLLRELADLLRTEAARTLHDMGCQFTLPNGALHQGAQAMRLSTKR